MRCLCEQRGVVRLYWLRPQNLLNVTFPRIARTVSLLAPTVELQRRRRSHRPLTNARRLRAALPNAWRLTRQGKLNHAVYQTVFVSSAKHTMRRCQETRCSKRENDSRRGRRSAADICAAANTGTLRQPDVRLTSPQLSSRLLQCKCE